MSPVRAVLDTNVLISGLCFGGPPGRILRLAVQGKVDLVTSPSLIEELSGVMSLKFPRRQSAVMGTLGELALLWEIVPSRLLPKLSVVAADPSDDRVLECAMAGRADCVVSGDKHLLGLAEFRGIPILAPARFLSRFKL